MKFLTKNTGLTLAMLVAVAPAMAMQTQKPAAAQKPAVKSGSFKDTWLSKEAWQKWANEDAELRKERQKKLEQEIAAQKAKIQKDLEQLKLAPNAAGSSEKQKLESLETAALKNVYKEQSAKNTPEAKEKADLAAAELNLRNDTTIDTINNLRNEKTGDLYKMRNQVKQIVKDPAKHKSAFVNDKVVAAMKKNVALINKEIATRSFKEKMASLNPFAMKDAVWTDRSNKERALMITGAVAVAGLTAAGIVALVKYLSKNELQKNEAALNKASEAAQYAQQARMQDADIAETYVADAVKKAEKSLTLLSAELKNELNTRAIAVDAATAEELETKTTELVAFVAECATVVAEQAEAQKETKPGFFQKMKNKFFGEKAEEVVA